MTRILLFGDRAGKHELGKFAQAIVAAAKSRRDAALSVDPQTPADIVVYASRSDEKIAEAVQAAERNACPILLLATGLSAKFAAARRGVQVIERPNTSLHTLRFIDDIVAFSQDFPGWKVQEFIEYHQATKQDVSGTALEIASKIGADPASIISIRDDDLARQKFSIDTSDGYAVHRLVFSGPDASAERVFQLVTVGRRSYAEGAIELTVQLALARAL